MSIAWRIAAWERFHRRFIHLVQRLGFALRGLKLLCGNPRERGLGLYQSLILPVSGDRFICVHGTPRFAWSRSISASGKTEAKPGPQPVYIEGKCFTSA